MATVLRYYHHPATSDGNQLAYIVHRAADVIALMKGMGADIDACSIMADEVTAELGLSSEDMSSVMMRIVEAVQTIFQDMHQT